MMREEFTNLTGFTPNPEEWKVIERVYTFHPMIDNVKGKQQVKALFEMGGVELFRILEPQAREVEKVEDQIRKTESELEGLRSRLNNMQDSFKTGAKGRP